MEIRFDYRKDVVYIDGDRIPLEDLRVWLSEHYTSMVWAHRIKRIHVSGGYRWTYDWDAVFYKAKTLLIIKKFHHEYFKDGE